MSVVKLLNDIEKEQGKKFRIRINNNRSSLVSIKRNSSYIAVSLHKMFLDAPHDVSNELCLFITGKRKVLPLQVKAFARANYSVIDHSHLVNPDKLIVVGKYFHLKELYDKINCTYFENKLDLFITWFGSHNKLMKSRFSLGLYERAVKLIKIHRLLDVEYVPQFVVEYVIFHEMLHAVCPPYVDERGIHRIHGKEFKRLEKNFLNYEEAHKWLKQYSTKFFLFGENNGRTQQMGKH